MDFYLIYLIYVLLISLGLSFCDDSSDCTSNEFTAPSDTDALAKEGEVRLKEFSLRAGSYGDCWEKAVADLRTGCKQLNEDVQRRLALSFANCFLQKSGSDVLICQEGTPIAECLRNANERVFSTYTEFFTHTQSICHFLEHKLWHRQTEYTIARLSQNSVKVSKQLDESQKSTSSMLKLQKLAYENQQQLINNSVSLNVELEKSRHNAKSIFEDFKSTTHEQRMLIFEIFDRIKKLQSVVLGEFTGVYTFIFYLISVIIAYLLTSTPRTSDARFWVLLTVTASAILERIIAVYSIDEETESSVLLDANGPIYHRVWMCRKAACVVAGFVLVWFASRYKDYNAINNKLLLEIKKQNWEMQKFIQSISNTPHKKIPSPSSSPKESNDEMKATNSSSPLEPVIPKSGNEREPLLNLPVEEKENIENSLLSPIARKGRKNEKMHTALVSKLKKPISTSTPKDAPSEKAKILINSPSDILEMSFSPSGRYNLRRRSKVAKAESDAETESPHSLSKRVKKAAGVKVAKAESDAETESPHSLSKRVKKAARESFENRQKIKNKANMLNAKTPSSDEE